MWLSPSAREGRRGRFLSLAFRAGRRISRKLTKYHSRLEETNEKVDGQPCADHNARYVAIMDRLNTIITYLQTKYPTSAS